MMQSEKKLNIVFSWQMYLNRKGKEKLIQVLKGSN